MKKSSITAKFLSLFLVAALLFLNAGCGLNDGSKKKNYSEFLTITVYDSLANYEGIQAGWFAQIVKDKFNMELSIIAPNVSSNGDAAFRDRFVAGNIGDLIICSNTGGQLQDMVNAGLVLDMRPYLDQHSELLHYESAIANLNEPFNEKRKNSVYGIPTSISTEGPLTPSESDTPDYGVYVRYDLYKELESPKIATLEDLLPLLKKMQELCPESDSGKPTYAFSMFSDWDGNMSTFAKQPCCFYGYDELGFALIDYSGEHVQNILDKDSLYYRSLKFYNEAYKLGLVDPDSALNNYSDVFAKTQDGQILFSPWPWLGQSAYNTEEHMSKGQAFMFVPIEDEQIVSYGANAFGSGDVVVCAGSKAKDPERIVDFIEWLYSSEGIYAACAARNQATAGPEGLTWEATDEGPVLTEFGYNAFLKNGDIEIPEEWGTGTWAGGVCQLNFTPVAETEKDERGYLYYYDRWESVKKLDRHEIEQEWMYDYNSLSVMDYVQEHNQLGITPATKIVNVYESPELVTIRNQCGNVITSYSWKLVFAKDDAEFESLFDEMVQKAMSYGYREIWEFDYANALNVGRERMKVLGI